MLNTIRLTIPQEHLGGLGGHTFKCLGNLSTGWTDWYQIWYKSADSPGNGHRLDTIRPSIPHGFGGVTNSKVWGSCQTTGLIGTKFGKRLRIRLGIDIGEIQFASHYPRGHFWGFRGSQIQTFFEAVKRLDQIWHTCADSSRNGYTPNKLPWRHRGGGLLGFFRGSNIQKSGEAVKRLDRVVPTLVHVCGFIWEWT